jgi:hypothetical protein
LVNVSLPILSNAFQFRVGSYGTLTSLVFYTLAINGQTAQSFFYLAPERERIERELRKVGSDLRVYPWRDSLAKATLSSLYFNSYPVDSMQREALEQNVHTALSMLDYLTIPKLVSGDKQVEIVFNELYSGQASKRNISRLYYAVSTFLSAVNRIENFSCKFCCVSQVLPERQVDLSVRVGKSVLARAQHNAYRQSVRLHDQSASSGRSISARYTHCQRRPVRAHIALRLANEKQTFGSHTSANKTRLVSLLHVHFSRVSILQDRNCSLVEENEHIFLLLLLKNHFESALFHHDKLNECKHGRLH